MLFSSKITPKSLIRLLQDVDVQKEIRRVVLDGLEGVVVPSEVATQEVVPCKRVERKSDVSADVRRATEVLHEYMSLPEDYRARMKMINAVSLSSFIVSGCLGQNLDLIWDACNRAVRDSEGDSHCAEVLSKVFDFYFDTINVASQGVVYERLTISSGEMLDEDFAVCASDGPQRAKITKVLLQGYRFSGKRGKVVRRSVVEIDPEVL